jgi:hypothetical protein
MKSLSRICIASVATLCVVGSASAHHSVTAFYDLKKEITVTGTVEEFRFVNPHSILRFNAETDGKAVLWRAESSPVSWLVRNGWKPSMFKKGTKVTIVGNPARDASTNMMRLLIVQLPDGTKLNANTGEALQ